jgi:translation elongation factor P/translation initiation factor 5A
MDMETYEQYDLPMTENEKAVLTAGIEVMIMEAMDRRKFYNVGEDE